MVTFLDVTGLEHFSSIFVFLFVWIVVYAILLWARILGENMAKVRPLTKSKDPDTNIATPNELKNLFINIPIIDSHSMA